MLTGAGGYRTWSGGLAWNRIRVGLRRRPSAGVLAMALVIAMGVQSARSQGGEPDKAAATTVPGVTVIAPKPFDAKAVPPAVLQDFVKSHSAPTRLGQLARWREPVCPTTVGLPPEFNAYVTERVKAVAANIGAPTRAPACRTNVEIIFTTQPQALLDSLRQKAPQLLGFHYPAQLRRLATVRHPIQAWYATATRGSGNNSEFTAAGAGQDPSSEAFLDDSCCPTPGGSAGSRLTAGVASELAAVVVVVDPSQLRDAPIGAIADQVAMMTLAEVDAETACGEIPSILDLTAATCAAPTRPEAITAADLAYLKALYKANLSQLIWAERDSIIDRMRADGGR
jgi:hypothetical protein